MYDGESGELELGQSRLERFVAARELAELPELVPEGWRGRVSTLEVGALEAFWLEALRYARWEIGRYARWRPQDEPVLPSGYDAEGIVQACFERLIRRERGVQIFYSAEDIRRKLRGLIKHRVRWLHERNETRLTVGEWDVLPARADGELASVFDYVPGRIEAPDQQVMQIEKERFLGEFKEGFEVTLEERTDLLGVFRGAWVGQKRREIGRKLAVGAQAVKALHGQLKRRLQSFSQQVRGGVKETLQGIKEGAGCRRPGQRASRAGSGAVRQ